MDQAPTPRGRDRGGSDPTETLPGPSVDHEEPEESSAPEERADEASAEERSRKRKKERRGGVLGFFRELPGLIIIAFLLALLIKTFLVQAFYIPSESMVPTLQIGDRVLVNKLVFDIREPRRGDIIVFENPNLQEPDRNILQAFWHWLTEGLGFSSDPTKDFIKRVVAVEGDTIEVRRGRVFVNGQRVEEPFVNPEARDRQDHGPEEVREDHVFVMGDNRPNSQDSRSALGQIPEEKIVGKGFVLLWPPSRISWINDGM